jgi:hypothetical protein
LICDWLNHPNSQKYGTPCSHATKRFEMCRAESMPKQSDAELLHAEIMRASVRYPDNEQAMAGELINRAKDNPRLDLLLRKAGATILVSRRT